MSIVNYKTPYKEICYDIDVKSYSWPWLPEGWDQLNGYIIRVKLLDGHVVGFYSFQVIEGDIIISKFCVHPHCRNNGIGTELHEDLVRFAIKYSKKKLKMTIHEENEFIPFMIKRKWKAIGMMREHFPDSRDGYTFELEI